MTLTVISGAEGIKQIIDLFALAYNICIFMPLAKFYALSTTPEVVPKT
jgi:hypothetical protein